MQSFLTDQLHKQKFTLLLVNVPSYVIQARFRSYVDPVVRAWLLVRPNTPSFQLSSSIFL